MSNQTAEKEREKRRLEKAKTVADPPEEEEIQQFFSPSPQSLKISNPSSPEPGSANTQGCQGTW